ncbi:MAG: ABC transporter permease, partial [Actinomycetia bacterium]|nr:ABC transporter permease [Actinomycetes bacterium]
MIRHLARRFVNYFILTSIATIFAYVACSSFMDPARRYEGKNPPIPQEAVDGILNEMGINPKVPVLVRTWNWLVRIVTQGSFNKDFSGVEVTSQIALKAGISLRLLVTGAVLAAVVGVALGVWGAVRQYKLSDQLITYTSYVLISTPTFVSGVLLMIGATWLNTNVFRRQVLRFTGQYTPGIEGFWPQLADRANHLLLPTIALMLLQSASYSRYQRAIMLDVLGSDYIRTARAKGATRTRA